MLKRPNTIADQTSESQSEEEEGINPHQECISVFQADASTTDEDEVDADGESEEEDDDDAGGTWFDSETKSFLASMLVHLVIIVGLASYTVVSQPEILSMFIESKPDAEELLSLDIVNDIAYSEAPSEEIGANSMGLTDMALSAAPNLADISELPAFDVDITMPNASVNASFDIKEAVGLTESNKAVRGMTGVGETGTEGAVDRITFELLQSIEQRPTLVVWLFDSSISMVKRRQEIRDRFDRIYEQLGIVQAEKRKRTGYDETDSLITSIVSFGNDVQFMTKKPTSDLTEIRSAIDKIAIDESGVEMVFHAIKAVADRYKTMRVSRGPSDPERNVVLITITDERGDDMQMADEAIALCKKFAIQSHVLGVPAPFGREFTYIKFVDPDPKFDQTPDWRQVDQGPETLLPERVQLGYQDNYFEEPVIDSGFGPYALARMCYETGGIYFSIHPNRKVGKKIEAGNIEAFASRMSYFFSPEIMDLYRPDYLSESEYMAKIKKSPLRESLIRAAQIARVGTLDKPQQVFIKREEALLVRDLTLAQQESARLAPELVALCTLLAEGEKSRSKESSLRWLASFDLSYGTAVAAKVRAEAYNAMLAKAKRGMNFEKPESNTWNLKPSDKITVDSKLEKEGKQATELLRSVAEKHKGTPWGLLAERELSHPLGWEWTESFTDLNPPPKPGRPTPPAPPTAAANEKARMLAPPPPKRPVTKI
jgi:von Willebrand factor type A domain